MSAATGHSHRPDYHSHRQRLLVAFCSQLVFFIIELVGGILTNSLALLADAGHMLSDVGALGLSLFALMWATRPPTPQRTYGYFRLEILVALVNGLSLWVISGYIFYEAYGRFFHPVPISSRPLLVIASLGLLVNLLGVYILYPAKKENINLRSAFLHLAADCLGSLAAIAAGLAILFRGWYWFDPLAGIVISIMIVLGSGHLVWEAANILMEATPPHLDLKEVQGALEAHPGVTRVYDLHIWTIASGIYALSVHVAVGENPDRDCLTWELEELLRRRFGVEHSTIQTEGPGWHDPQVCPLTFLGEAADNHADKPSPDEIAKNSRPKAEEDP